MSSSLMFMLLMISAHPTTPPPVNLIPFAKAVLPSRKRKRKQAKKPLNRKQRRAQRKCG